MNILIITYLFDPEPIVMSTITKDLAIELSKKHKVTVLTSKPCRPYGYKFDGKELTNPSWPFMRIVMDTYTNPKSSFSGRWKENISFGKGAVSFIKKHNEEIDVIYISAFPLFSQKMIIKCAREFNIPVVNHIEDIYPEPFLQKIPYFGKLVYKSLLPMDKWIVNNATVSIVIGKKIKEYFVKTRKVDPDKIEVVYNWQDESRYQSAPSLKEGNEPFTFMYVGSISKAANLHLVLDAFVLANIDKARLVFAGSGNELASLKSKAAGSDTIVFMDARAEQVGEIQSKADVMILPLLPTVALRAVPSKTAAYLFSHKSVLACVEKDSDVADIICGGECGWITSPSDVNDVATKMKEIAQLDTNALRQMGENGYEYSQLHLTREVNLKKLANIVCGCKVERSVID
jgi:glycosyltransferase involved in cell wall biosynthesis